MPAGTSSLPDGVPLLWAIPVVATALADSFSANRFGAVIDVGCKNNVARNHGRMFLRFAIERTISS
jgi:hypothetical protein